MSVQSAKELDSNFPQSWLQLFGIVTPLSKALSLAGLPIYTWQTYHQVLNPYVSTVDEEIHWVLARARLQSRAGSERRSLCSKERERSSESFALCKFLFVDLAAL